MTEQELADRLLNDPRKTLTRERIQRLRAACQRVSCSYDAVLRLLPVGVQQEIANLK